jgi:hypothetical protein
VIEQHAGWLFGRRYLSNYSLEALLDNHDTNRKETRELTAV